MLGNTRRRALYGVIITAIAACTQGCGPKNQDQAAGPKKDFIEEIREQLAKEAPAQPVRDGTLPPTGGDTSKLPTLALDSTNYDLGEVPRDKSSVHEITVRNTGQGDLIVREVITSCACTVGTMDNKVISPGGSAPMKVTVYPDRLGGFEAERHLTIVSNDPRKPRHTFSVKSRVDPEFAVDPPVLTFGDVRKGSQPEGAMIVRQLSDEPIEIKEIQTSPGVQTLEVSHDKIPEAQWKTPGRPEYTIKVRLRGDIATGPFQAWLTLTTTCKRLPTYALGVKGEIKAPYTIMPQMLRAVNVVPGQERVASATISGQQAIQITDLAISGPELSVSSRPDEKENSVVIDLGVLPNATPGQKSEELSFMVHSGDDAIPERLRVFCLVTKPGGAATSGPAPAGKPGTPETPPGVPAAVAPPTPSS